jgi:RNA polymerase sigma-70 factor (ECF subfamily)
MIPDVTSVAPNPDGNRSADPASPEERAAAIGRLFREHNRKLVGFLVARLRNEHEAKEVAQEAYVRLLQLEAAPGTVSYLRSYLFRVAENLATDRIRRRHVHTQFDNLESGGDLFEEASAERAAIAAQELALLKCAVAELPDVCRDVFTLHKLADRPIEVVAALTGLKERMVRRYLRRALVYVCLRREGHSPAQSWKVMP